MDAQTIAQTACEVHGASQDAGELEQALTLIGSDRAVIVEIGCDRGGTLWAWRQVCPTVFGVTLVEIGRAHV